ncbi:phosphate-starvation-inducible PsiE family protein [Thermus caliditerrae]|uniref:Phosphate-starvation-inducible E-like protein n=1 Tax=Thermus caliditerrae TaxID=1330700 RepID=A0A7C5VHI1_9DEIN|nr:phosphate-starvation-inducible PsiE family protein [Thermus caliditerrae]
MKRDAFRVLQVTETVIYLFAGFLIAAGAAVLLLSTMVEGMRHLLDGGYSEVALALLDRILLAMMLAEILYTLLRFAREGTIEAVPFLVIGIIAAVRRVLVLTAEAVEKFDLADPAFLAVLAELGLLAFLVVAFALAIRLVRPSAGQ